MNVLLIGPCPPPRGGISVHVAEIQRQLLAAGVGCRTLDTGRIGRGGAFTLALLRHALQGWTLHLHTNGHNWKSWILVLWCGLAAIARSRFILTLHSGMMPEYLRQGGSIRRSFAALVCGLSERIVCVNPEMRDSLVALGVPPSRIEVLPAFVATPVAGVIADPADRAWIADHRPVITTSLSLRPEYGFDLLVAAVARLRAQYPRIGCLVMGIDPNSPASALIRETGIEEHFRLLGDIDHPACLAAMAAGDLFVRPTLADGDSISVREALALGKPVVASNVGARPSGATLFDSGNVEQMVDRIHHVVTTSGTLPAQWTGCMQRLFEIYRCPWKAEGGLCPT